MALSIMQENQQMKKDLDFCNTEIERLRAKLVFEDSDMPSLSAEMIGAHKPRVNSSDIELESGTRYNNNENVFNLNEGLKDVI